jgi:hypothetical protein
MTRGVIPLTLAQGLRPSQRVLMVRLFNSSARIDLFVQKAEKKEKEKRKAQIVKSVAANPPWQTGQFHRCLYRKH